MPFLFEFAELDFEFELEELAGLLGGEVEEILGGEEVGPVVFDHADVGRDGDLAIGEGVEGLLGGRGIGAGGEVNEDFDVLGGVILHAGDLDLALVVGGEDGVDQRGGGLAEGELGDGEEVLLAGFDPGATFHTAATLAIIILRNVGDAAGGEVGHDLGLLLAE